MDEGIAFDEIKESMKEEIYDNVCQEFDYIDDLPLSGDQKQTIISDIVDYVFAELWNQPICECSTYE